MKFFRPLFFLAVCSHLLMAQIGRMINFIPNTQFSVSLRLLMTAAALCFAALCVWGALRSWRTLTTNLDINPSGVARLLQFAEKALPKKFWREVFEPSVNEFLLDWIDSSAAHSGQRFQKLMIFWKGVRLAIHLLLAAVKEFSGLVALIALISKFFGK